MDKITQIEISIANKKNAIRVLIEEFDNGQRMNDAYYKTARADKIRYLINGLDAQLNALELNLRLCLEDEELDGIREDLRGRGEL